MKKIYDQPIPHKPQEVIKNKYHILVHNKTLLQILAAEPLSGFTNEWMRALIERKNT